MRFSFFGIQCLFCANVLRSNDCRMSGKSEVAFNQEIALSQFRALSSRWRKGNCNFIFCFPLRKQSPWWNCYTGLQVKMTSMCIGEKGERCAWKRACLRLLYTFLFFFFSILRFSGTNNGFESVRFQHSVFLCLSTFERDESAFYCQLVSGKFPAKCISFLANVKIILRRAKFFA